MKAPPNDLDAEACLLGSLLIGTDAEAKRRVCRILKPDDFLDSDGGPPGIYGRVFQAVKRRVDASKPLDGVLVRSDLLDAGKFDSVSISAVLEDLLNAVPSAAHLEEYAVKVKAKSDARKAIRVCEGAIRRLYENADVQAVVSESLGGLSQIRESSLRQSGRTIEAILHDKFEKLQSGVRNYLPSCLTPLQDILGGYKFGRMTVTAALPSVGKSTIAKQELMEWARGGTRCGLITVEEDEDIIACKMLATYGEVPNYRIEKGELSGEDWKKITDGLALAANDNLIVVESPVDLDSVLGHMDMLVHKHGCRAVAIDHFHLIRTRAGNETEMQTTISNALRARIKELGIAGLVVAQLNKQSYGRECRIPTRGDLRGSGALDADAGTIVFIHREDVFNIGKPHYMPNNVAQFIVAKNRGGRSGDTGDKVVWCGDYQRYEVRRIPGVNYDPFSED